VYWFFRLWSWTWRLTVIEHPEMRRAREAGEPLVFAHWHGSELCVLTLVTRYRIATMTSTSADGQLIDFVIGRLGGATSRGSSTRGAVGALKGLVRLVGRGYRASMAVDGPRGPIYQVKPGVFELSRLAKARIIPTGAACSHPITFQKSWNKAQLPKPFSRVVVIFEEPWPVFSRDQDARDEACARRLADQLSAACQSAAEHLRS
jgi:lysophospholipid acyltransferase (LPLAT)-like uncharacterized protein